MGQCRHQFGALYRLHKVQQLHMALSDEAAVTQASVQVASEERMAEQSSVSLSGRRESCCLDTSETRTHLLRMDLHTLLIEKLPGQMCK